MSRLLEKRGLKFTSFDAFLAGQDKPLDLSEDCSKLGCREVRTWCHGYIVSRDFLNPLKILPNTQL